MSLLRITFHLRPIWAVLSVILVSLPASAQEWTGSIGLGYVWQDVSGSEDSFRTQLGLQEGFLLDELTLAFRGDAGLREFTVDAWGFGDANPSERARFGFGFAGDVGLAIDYDRRTSFFRLAESGLRLRSDDWEITRWKGTLSFDGWAPLNIDLIGRWHEREGTVVRPLYGLNELYPMAIDLDESMSEATIRVATRTLPVRLELEQSWAEYERRNRRAPVGDGTSYPPPNPDLLDESTFDFDDTTDVPTTRFTASYGSRRFEGVATVLYADADFDTQGATFNSFAIGGGDTGSISFLDEVVASAQMENLAAAMNLGFRIARSWTIRLDGNYRDATTDTGLLGSRMVSSNSPLGSGFELSTPLEEDGRYETTEGLVRATVEFQAHRWRVWAGGLTASREVAWDQASAVEAYAVERDSDGWFAGAGLGLGQTVDATFEYSRGDFQRYVFRTDPQDVDRAVLKLRSGLGKGWRLNVHGMYEAATNPAEWAGSDWETTPYGVGISWEADSSNASAGLTVDRLELTSETGLILPSGEADASLYDTDITVGTLFGRLDGETWRLYGSATYLTDDGSTWPLQSWNAELRASIITAHRIEYGVLGEYWSYDEERGDLDDYDVTRFGVFVTWRF